MKTTTIDIIKLLPFEDKFKKDFLLKFDGLSADQKFEIERVIWDAYDAYYQILFDKNFELGLLEAKVNDEKIDKDFRQKVQEKTEAELRQEFHEEAKGVDLTNVRERLQAYITPVNDRRTTN